MPPSKFLLFFHTHTHTAKEDKRRRRRKNPAAWTMVRYVGRKQTNTRYEWYGRIEWNRILVSCARTSYILLLFTYWISPTTQLHLQTHFTHSLRLALALRFDNSPIRCATHCTTPALRSLYTDAQFLLCRANGLITIHSLCRECRSKQL